MTKHLATFESGDLHTLLIALEMFGYSHAHPRRNAITAWDSSGEELTLSFKEEVLPFLSNGRGEVQLWLSSVDDVFLSVFEGKPRLYFDGFTQGEKDILVHFLRTQHLDFTVSEEKDTFNAQHAFQADAV